MNKVLGFSSVFLFAVALALILSSGSLSASSHSEAPGISKLASLDGTDVYAFVSPDKPTTVTLIALYYPLLEPNAGPNFYRFNDAGVYDILVDTNGDCIEDVTYRFTFSTDINNKDSVLAYLPGSLNITQHYKVTEIRGSKHTVLGTGTVAQPRVGPVTTPNYGGTIFDEGISTFGNVKTFAGLTDDPFFADLASLFDALTIRKLPGNQGGGRDGLSGFNVLATAVQVPIGDLGGSIIGVWQESYVPRTTIQTRTGQQHSGGIVEVSRLGMPLVNELIIPLKDKEKWNSSEPKDDAQFLSYVTDPQIAQLIHAVYGIPVPPAPRNDLVAIFLTGIEGLNKPTGGSACEELRLNMTIPPAKNPNRLGLLAGDKAGFPNGRRLADDVVDITLRAAAGGTPFTPSTNKAPNNQLGDGVDANDEAFQTSFPYLALPHNPLQKHHKD